MSNPFDALKSILPIELNALAVWADAHRTAKASGVLHLDASSTHHLSPVTDSRSDALKYIWALR